MRFLPLLFMSYYSFHTLSGVYTPIKVPLDEWVPHAEKLSEMTVTLEWSNKTRALDVSRGMV